eukprot:gb/GFBE01077889.1/.p1 GENE.gb/GFBE01077889.1/~~gb/GFBE01077889.1/.p1  ORF type:complete len:142 (+),score=44.39 gb/GFBE01077889.1/:1-426(+)
MKLLTKSGKYVVKFCKFHKPILNNTAKNNIKKAIRKLKKQGVSNPERKHYIVNIGDGFKNKVSVKLNCLPTITANRGRRLEYYDMKLGRPFTLHELMRAQGADPKKLKQTISDARLGEMTGNAMSIPVVKAVIRKMLPLLR